MKRQSFGYLILSFALVILGCKNKRPFTDATSPVKTNFKNQGEQEDYWAEGLFARDYKIEHYKKYKSPIILNDNNYIYKDMVITVGPVPELRAIFNEGLFYPGVMAKSFKYQPKIQLNKDSLKAWIKRDTSKVRYVIPKVDSVWITDFQEVKFLETMPNRKKFRFWLFRKGFANPTVYFMELTNKRANSDTPLLSFIDGAKLTFFQEGWVIM